MPLLPRVDQAFHVTWFFPMLSVYKWLRSFFQKLKQDWIIILPFEGHKENTKTGRLVTGRQLWNFENECVLSNVTKITLFRSYRPFIQADRSDGCGMDNPLSPALAKISMSKLEADVVPPYNLIFCDCRWLILLKEKGF